jgi:predicted ATP-grasp superfamily ATP-dependent carboligase
MRRFPKNNGQACYHVTEWIPDIAEMGLNFFKGINFRGLGNVEFKRDLRDGKLKIIESNARFTAAQELLASCGMDISVVIYKHLAGLPVPQLNSYKQGLTLWFPHQDYLAYKELKELNEITFGKWAKSIARRHVMPHFKLADPLPTIVPFLSSLKNKIF